MLLAVAARYAGYQDGFEIDGAMELQAACSEA